MLWSPNTQLLHPFENTALDYSGNARHGTVFGSGVYATKPNGGRCLYFDGVGDYVKTPSFALSGTVVVFAADARYKVQASGIQVILSDNAGSNTVGYLFCRLPGNTTNLMWYYADGAGQRLVVYNNFFSDDVWTHMVIVCDYAGAKTYFYRSGMLIQTSSMTGTPVFPSTARARWLGSLDGTNYMLTQGYLANVQLWTLATMPAAGQMLANVNRLMLGMNPIW